MFRAGVACALAILAAGPVASASSRAGEITIVVTSSADEVNGDTSSWSALQAMPGPDGISLREAIQTTNNAPGSYLIRFAPDLAGHTIGIDLGGNPLTLAGGNVSIDGDITGDGRPDITLRKASGPDMAGLVIASGGNTLHAIALRGFWFGAVMQAGLTNNAATTGQTYAGNTVSGLVISGENGIGLQTRAGNRWLDTKILGNTMTVTDEGGVQVMISKAAGDRIHGLTIERNTVRMATPVPAGGCLPAGSAMGITAIAGGATGDAHGLISDVLIDHNSVSGSAAVGIMVGPGGSGTFASTVEHIRLLDNRVDLEESPKRCMSGGGVRQDLMVVAGDDNSTRTPEHDNVVRDVEIRGNRLATGEGIRIFAGSGGARNTIRHLTIADNTIHVIGHFPGVNLHGCEGGKFITTTGSRISDVTIHANHISTVKEHPRQVGKHDGGIYVAGCDSENVGPAADARVDNVRVTGNHVNTRMIGINLVGGNAVKRSVLLNVLVARNTVTRAPDPLFRFTPQTRGISVVGGTGEGARGNRVACVRVTHNSVAGVRDAVSVIDNAYDARGNRATFGGC